MAEDALALPLLGGRYRCDRLLKSGSGVETFVGTDLEEHAPVVVKRVAEVGTMERAWVRLAHEAEVLRRLESRSFRAPVTTGREGGTFYMVRPFVEGETLAERLKDGPLSLASVLRVGMHLLEALQQAHDHHVLHRDIKPANVIVDSGEPLSSVVLIDFGFARSPTLDSAVRDERVGTARYLAPEAAGLLDREVDERSDLYSFGVVLFECSAGRPPFEADDVGQLLRQHLNAAPPSLRELRPDAPRALDAIVQRLLRKEPAERYQSAGAVLADLRLLDEALARGNHDPVLVVGAHDNRPALTEPAFVGRNAELELLAHAVRLASAGEGGVVLLEAESGGGKSRLLDELALRVGAEAWVLRGQGVDQGAQRPFQVLDGLVHGVESAALQDAAVAAAIRRAVGDRADAAVAAIPDLAATFDVDTVPNLGPEAYGETRSIAALSVVLQALGETTGRPALVLLDDCQWADASTLKLLAQWPTELPCHTVVVAAFRTEEVPADHVLRKGRPIAHVELPAFEPADVESLAESMAGTLPAEAIDTVATLSEGSPFMAAAVLRGLVETGALVHEPRGWRIDQARLADVQTSRRAALFLVRRLELLKPATLDLLTVGAILGKEFEADLAGELCGLDQPTIAAGLEEAAQRRIVWPDEGTSHARFLHDKLREALLGRLAPDQRAALHLRAASRIEAIDANRTFELAYHFDAARRDDLALPYALRAAETARAQHSLDVALANYRIADSALRANGDPAARAEVAEALGDVLTLQGSYDEATEQLNAALEEASTDIKRAALMGKLGEVQFKKGDQRTARMHLEAAVNALHRRLPKHTASRVFALLIEVVVQAAHSLFPRLFLHRRDPAGAEREFLAIRLYSRLAYCYWFNAGKVACLWAHLREMNLAERYTPTLELAQAYSEHAPAATIVPWFSRGLKYVRRSLEIREQLGDVWGQGQSYNFYGVLLYAASRHREALEKLDEAYRRLDQTGDRWEANVALWNKAYAHYRLGELTTAVRVGQRLHESATVMGDMTAAGGGISAWALASGGQVPAHVIRTQLDCGLDDAQTDAEVNVAESLRLMSDGDYTAAAAVLQGAAKIVKDAGLRQEYIAPVQPWLATALRLQAEAAMSWDLTDRKATLRRGRKAMRAACRLAFFYRNNWPHALREAALYAAIAGRTNKAKRLLARSLAAAEAQDAVYERLLTLRAWASTGLDVLGVPATVALESAEAELGLLVPHPSTLEADDSAGPSLSLLDRFSTLLAAGREIAAASTVEGVFAAVHQASSGLLRGDHCEVLAVSDKDGASLLEGDAPPTMSRTIVRNAIGQRRVIVMSLVEGDALDSSDSLELSGVRSAMCAPITAQGAVVAIVYVSHGGFEDLFGDNEVAMAEFITTLAGAALEHVANTEAELRKMLDDLTVTSSLLEATLEATLDGILVVDRYGRMTSYNQRFGELWDIPQDVLSARDDKRAIQYVLDRLSHPEEFVAKVEELYADPEAESFDTIEFKDGRVFERGSKPQRIGDEVVGRVWSFRDVTERVRGETALAIARDKAMEASRLKSEFVATTSHEIRTPMNGVIGLTGLLLETELSDVQREYAEAVRMSAEALLGVINDILDFSKIEAGKLELEDVDFDLKLALEDVASLVARGAAAKQLSLSWDCDASVPAGLRGDVGRLRQILLNLLANAVKFTEHGGVRLHASNAGWSEGGHALVRFEVIDTGVGLKPEDRDRLFEPFSQADASTTRRFGGTGLGLAICARLAEAMGGVIGVDSEFDVGSTFWVEIPFTVAHKRTGRAPVPPTPPRAADRPGRSGRVLVAEDNAINQLVAKEMIRRLGYECDVVANGAEALEALQLRRYGAVLMDCYMPEMDGFAATRELRERERKANAGHTPVIAMTALAMAEDRDRCTASGMDDYVSKPVNLMALGATLERWVPRDAVAAG